MTLGSDERRPGAYAAADPHGSAAVPTGVRPRLTRTQLELVSAITKSAELKRRLVGATDAVGAGALVRVEDGFVRLGEVLGSGLVGVVHAASCERTGTALAVKRARAHLAFFREALRVERRVAALVGGLSGSHSAPLSPAPILAYQDHVLAKELVVAPTLAELLVRDTVDRAQATALEGVLEVVRHGLEAWGIALDVSPKNLAWQGRWILLDAGPKLRIGEAARIAEARSFATYVDAHRRKLASGPSAPSAISARLADEERLGTPRRHAFVRDLWRWFPLDLALDAATFTCDVDDTASSDEVAILRTEDGAFEVMADLPDAIVAAARSQWDDTPVPTQSLAPLAPSPIGRVLRGSAAPSAPRRPSPPIERYDHWRDVLDPSGRHTPLDLFCHDLLATDVEPYPSAGPRARIRLPTPAGTFAELAMGVFPGRSRAYILVPGFRAGIDATVPLVQALVDRGQRGVFVSAYLGARTVGERAIVTSGEWEQPLLVQTIDHVVRCQDVEHVTLIAASHGALAAMEVANLHPAVDTLVVDSPLATPLELYFHVARAHGTSRQDAQRTLVEHGLPSEARSFRVPSRPGLRTLALRPVPDDITAVCGFAEGAETTIEYPGPHAATIRHDAKRRGIPIACVDVIDAFL